MDKEKVLDLAKLARIDISNDEAESLSKEFKTILGYVSEVRNITNNQYTNKLENVSMSNVMREDTRSHERGLYTEKILAQAPARGGDYIKVKKIL